MTLKIGFTYDLQDDYLKQGFTPEEVAELDFQDTIDGVEQALLKCGFKVERIGNIQQLVQVLSAGKRYDFIFNIAEGMHGRGRESAIPALLDAYQIPYTFSDPATIALTLDKAYTKRILRDAKIATSPFYIIRSIEDIDSVPKSLFYPLFIKPVAEGSSKGIYANSLINSENQLQKGVRQLLEKFKQPVLVEQYLSGREFSVGMLGTGPNARILGVVEITMNSEHNFFCQSLKWGKLHDKPSVKLVEDAKADEVAFLALETWKLLGCRDAGRVDIKCDDTGKPYVLEVNPISGLCPGFQDLNMQSILVFISESAGLPYDGLIKAIADYAIMRTNTTTTL